MYKTTNIIGVVMMLCLTSFQGIAISLSAFYDAKHDQVKVNWTKSETTIRQFTLQRSTNQYNWTNIAYQDVTDYNGKQVFQFIDDKPLKGKNYYRLMATYANGAVVYSAVEEVNAEPVKFDFKIYPVPVGDEFTIEYKGTAPLKGVINVLVQNMNGVILTRMRFASTNTIMRIPALNLVRGAYDVRVVVEDEVVWGRQIVK